MFRLATLLSQLDGDATVPALIRNQLEMWKVTEADLTIAPELVRLYRLLAGTVVVEDSQGRPESALSGLGWLRGIGVLFWYCSSTDSFVENIGTLSSALDSYRIVLQDSFADPPVSPFVHDQDRQGANVSYPATTNGLYSLLELLFPSSSATSADLDHASLELDIRNNTIAALRPSGYTRDALDHRASYLLLVMLESAGISHISATHACIIRQHYIFQLLGAGLWQWALYVALQLPDASARYCLVTDILMRFAGDCEWDAEGNAPTKRAFVSLQAFLTNALNLPESLLHESAAYYAGDQRNYNKQVSNFISAGKFRLATEITVNRIAPTAMLASGSASSKLLQLLETIAGLAAKDATAFQTPYADHYADLSDVFLSFLRLKNAIEEVGSGGKKATAHEVLFAAMAVPDLLREARRLIGRITTLYQQRKAQLSASQPPQHTVFADIQDQRYIEVVLFDMCTYLYKLAQRLDLAAVDQEGGADVTAVHRVVHGLLATDVFDSAPVLCAQLATTTAQCNNAFLQHAAGHLIASQS
jgi:hypothetical protein